MRAELAKASTGELASPAASGGELGTGTPAETVADAAQPAEVPSEDS
jgi:hypothetical protein